MDNRIANDMISSGMIPSGEKKKEETLNEHHKKDADGNTIPHEDEELKEGAGLYANIHAKRKRGGKMRKKGAKGAPSSQDFANAAKTAKEEVEMKEGIGMAAKAALGVVKNIAKKQVVKDVARGAAAQFGAQAVGSMMNSGGGQQKPKTGTVSATQYASADLFDIVKGKLLDEGLSEEEIRDIMLTLTPDEIMNEMAVNPNIAAMDAKKIADMIARAQANKVPDKVKEASKRQMKAGTPREDPKNPYTTQDKKTIIDYNKDK